MQLAHADTQVGLVEAIGDVPAQGAELAPLLHQSMEETQPEEEFLPDLRGRGRGRGRGREGGREGEGGGEREGGRGRGGREGEGGGRDDLKKLHTSCGPHQLLAGACLEEGGV